MTRFGLEIPTPSGNWDTSVRVLNLMLVRRVRTLLVLMEVSLNFLGYCLAIDSPSRDYTVYYIFT